MSSSSQPVSMDKKIEYIELKTSSQMSLLDNKFSFIIDSLLTKMVDQGKLTPVEHQEIIKYTNDQLESTYELRGDPTVIRYNFDAVVTKVEEKGELV